ncbi:DNA replication and repair protein RecF [Hyphomonas neptunium ATCC 15444]|uniref:DNA replication and repair protein RecF n=2 Tax=Hyphomonas TaxID=85 RepID=Q0C4Q3_HYPNA|nr:MULTISPECIES: DNA replication/repair protein RecF [Hyphomonas]ABI76366.1 DNA replication and repair protein RecF [Hyphomonas neptunium ATCC 15444]KCZ96497.1 DNA replication and repair protein RecF [Hyphomonas hirschiana VP5]
MTALTRLSLTDFRNYAGLTLRLDARPVCLYGSNGAGKTNLLEAVSQFGPGRGLRSAQLSEMTRRDAPGGWALAATLDDEQKISITLDTAGTAKRTVRIDGAPASPGDLAERIRIVWLTPAMDGVFRGGASDRRRFFDRLVMAHLPAHGKAAARYDKALAERNALIERGHVDPAWADAIEARLAEAGTEMAINRAIVLEALQIAIDARPEGHFPKADLTLEGAAEAAALKGEDFRTIFDLLVDAYHSGRRRDIGAGRTLSGPHRTDLAVIHRPTAAPAGEASTGQQKALLIGLVLASATALSAGGSGPSPLLLLDEAAAHLDPDRRAALFDELTVLGGQAWLTGTEAFLFEAFGDRAQRIRVDEGSATLAE